MSGSFRKKFLLHNAQHSLAKAIIHSYFEWKPTWINELICSWYRGHQKESKSAQLSGMLVRWTIECYVRRFLMFRFFCLVLSAHVELSFILHANCVTISSFTFSFCTIFFHSFFLNPKHPNIFSTKSDNSMKPLWCCCIVAYFVLVSSMQVLHSILLFHLNLILIPFYLIDSCI